MATKINERQYALAGYGMFKPANIGAGNGLTFALPPGAILLRLTATTLTAFNGTTPTMTASDGTTTFVNAQSVAAAGAVTVAVAQKFYPTGGEIDFSITESAASGLVPATAGQSIAVVTYVQAGRGGEVQG